MHQEKPILVESILVNGEPVRLPERVNIDGLLAQLGLADRHVAVAVNREVIPRSRFASAAVADGDRVEILEAVGGG